MTLVDTSAWIEYLRGTGSAAHVDVRALIARGEAAWCEIIVLELLNGVSANEAARVQKLRPSLWVLELDAGVWAAARSLVDSARRNAVTAPLPDLIIAACARSYDVKVLHHHDAHFDSLAKMKI